MHTVLHRNTALILKIIIIFGLTGCQDNGNLNQGTIYPGPQPNINEWIYQYSDVLVNLNDVFFLDKNIGWIVGEYNTILSTTMGGETWPQAPVNSYEGNFRSVQIISNSNGWIVGDLNDQSLDGNIYISVNGGAYPEPQRSTDYPMNVVFSLDENNVWFGGENGQMIYTTDGGINWNEPVDFPGITIFDIHFIDNKNGYASGNEGNILKTTDGGTTWQNDFQYNNIDILAIHFYDSTSGWACGSGNTILLFRDQGTDLRWSLTEIDNEPASIVWRDIFFVDDDRGWVIGDDGAIYRSANGGNSWEKEKTGVISELNAIYMLDHQTGWVVGNEGVILTYNPL